MSSEINVWQNRNYRRIKRYITRLPEVQSDQMEKGRLSSTVSTAVYRFLYSFSATPTTRLKYFPMTSRRT
ncbi:MAG: hypothetical protein LBR10_04305 [Prevotellaceae bacterium]|jgi:hypothetical protein|nr:hypothetical protein [Prevotellaceae bacterium]